MEPAPRPGRVLRGRVGSFDEDAGYGTLVDEDGREVFFHCTAIAGGSRTIEVGAPVCFTVGAGRLGRWEAGSVLELSPAARSARPPGS